MSSCIIDHLSIGSAKFANHVRTRMQSSKPADERGTVKQVVIRQMPRCVSKLQPPAQDAQAADFRLVIYVVVSSPDLADCSTGQASNSTQGRSTAPQVCLAFWSDAVQLPIGTTDHCRQIQDEARDLAGRHSCWQVGLHTS